MVSLLDSATLTRSKAAIASPGQGAAANEAQFCAEIQSSKSGKYDFMPGEILRLLSRRRKVIVAEVGHRRVPSARPPSEPPATVFPS